MKNQKIKINTKPRCSISKLGEYVSSQSSPSRRKDIVKTQKYPPTCQVVTYAPATKVIVDLVPEEFDRLSIAGAVNVFTRDLATAVTSYEKTQAKCCIDALTSFLPLSENLADVLSGCSTTPGPQTWSIELAGVNVSLRPELFLSLEGKNGKPAVGFVKFNFSKSHRLDNHAAAVIAEVMCEKARLAMPSAVISNQHVLIVDVFGGKIYTAPDRQIRLLKEAIAACEEIAHLWTRELAS